MGDRTFRTLGPFPKDADRRMLSWLARESAQRALAAQGYELIEHTEHEVPLDEVPPKTLKNAIDHGIDPTEHLWIEQTSIGRVNKPVLNWLIAECKWRNEQLKSWIAAETAWETSRRA